MSEIKIDSSISYMQSDTKMSKYKLSQVLQQVGGMEVQLGASNQTSIFEIPVNTYNLAQSVLSFQQEIKEIDTKYIHTYRATPPIAQLQLYSRSGAFLADISHFNNFCVSTLQSTKPTKDFIGSQNDIIVPLNNTSRAVNFIKTEVKGTAQGAGAVNTIWQIQGSELYNTIMSLDKSIYVPEVLNLKIVWLPVAAVGWSSDNQDGTGNEVALAACLISNLKFLLAVEQNDEAKAALVQQTTSAGMSVMFPSSTTYKTTLQPSTNHSISVRASRGMGERLERVFTSWVLGNETPTTMYVSEAKDVNSFYTLLDSQRQQEFDITTVDQNYRSVLHPLIKDKAAGCIGNIDTKFSFQESWCDDMTNCAVNQERAGRDLNVERKYDFYAQFAQALAVPSNYYTTVVCQRQLMLMGSGVQVS